MDATKKDRKMIERISILRARAYCMHVKTKRRCAGCAWSEGGRCRCVR
jgi:hypothetical protein